MSILSREDANFVANRWRWPIAFHNSLW